MSNIIIFGGGGRLGRLAVGEARARGHRVTAAVRDPTAHVELERPGVSVSRVDVTDADGVAIAARGHTAAIASLYQDVVPHDMFYADATRALLDGLGRAGVHRLLVVGMAANLELEPGVRIMDSPGFPPEQLPFALGHTVALHVLRACGGPLDWLVLTPPLQFDPVAPRTAEYRTGGDAVLGDRMSYADCAVALIDEIESPVHHRRRIALAS